MRRVFAILMVVILLPITVLSETISREEYYKQVQEDTKEILASIVSVYEEDPEGFDADYIMIAYSYFMEFMSLRRVNTIEGIWHLKELTEKTLLRDFDDLDMLNTESMLAYIETTFMDKFIAWTKGEETDTAFAEYIIKMIKSMALEEGNT